eukprot:11714817-Prorocentrum_lima.AAC.1
MGARTYGRRWGCCWCAGWRGACSWSAIMSRQLWWSMCGCWREWKCGVRRCAQMGGVHGVR